MTSSNKYPQLSKTVTELVSHSMTYFENTRNYFQTDSGCYRTGVFVKCQADDPNYTGFYKKFMSADTVYEVYKTPNGDDCIFNNLRRPVYLTSKLIGYWRLSLEESLVLMSSDNEDSDNEE